MAYAQQLAQPAAEGAMNSLVVITRPGTATFDETSREYQNGTASPIYDDPDFPGVGAKAGITLASGPITMNLGDEPQYYSSATISIPQSAPINPRIDDIVLVTANQDKDMIGRYFRVVDVPVGGRISASIDLSCVGIAPSRQWGTK